MKRATFSFRLLLATFIACCCIPSCTVDDDFPPISIPVPEFCQIKQLFYLPPTQTHIGFPELFSSPMQDWDFGINVDSYNSDGSPASAHGMSSVLWESVTFDYNTDGAVQRIVQHAFKATQTTELFCPVVPCQKLYIFTYDQNKNPVKITGETKDYNGNSLGTYPVCDNAFDADGRLTQQTYPNGSYWRYEYKLGNLFKMYFKDPKAGTEQLKYQFLAYDKNSNWAKTNPLWRIYTNTYSDNNPTSFHQFTGKQIPLPTGGAIDEFIDVKVNYVYGANSGRLPTSIDFADANTGDPFFKYPSTISYQCKPMPLPGQ